MTSLEIALKKVEELQKQLEKEKQAAKKRLEEENQAFKKQLEEAYKKEMEEMKKQLEEKDAELKEKDAELKDLKGKRKLESLLDKDSSKKKSTIDIYTAESTSSEEEEEEEEDSNWSTSPPSNSQEQYRDAEKYLVWCEGLQTVYSSKHAKIKSLMESRCAFRDYWNGIKAMMEKEMMEKEVKEAEAIRTAGIARFVRPLTRPEHMGTLIFQDASGKFAPYRCPGYFLQFKHAPCKSTINPYNSKKERTDFSAWELDHTPTWSIIKSALSELQFRRDKIDWVAVTETICCVRVLKEGEKQLPENKNHGAVLRCKSCHTASESFQKLVEAEWRNFLLHYFRKEKGKERESSPEV